uniref:Glucose-1-phosphate adenylyltransferase (ADP-glucose synthase) (ADP-glucose pyrophosphorylase) (ADPGlc PPase) n=1 Tax=mine drainage metagenome TaxID=410659 RepID=E6QER3_9ZZZZ
MPLLEIYDADRELFPVRGFPTQYYPPD